MGVGGLLSKVMGKPKAPDQAAIQAAQERAAKAERDKIAQDEANKQNAALKKSEADRARRAQFVSGITPEDDETQRRRFLQGV